MATYEELFDLHSDSALRNKATVACIVAAETIIAEEPTTENHTNRLIWAANALNNPKSESIRMYWALLAANAEQTVSAITGASDSVIQGQVEAHVDLFATGS